MNFTLYDTFEKSHLSRPCFSSILRGDRQTVMDIRAVFFQLREQNWNELFEIERNEWSEWKNKIKCEKKRREQRKILWRIIIQTWKFLEISEMKVEIREKTELHWIMGRRWYLTLLSIVFHKKNRFFLSANCYVIDIFLIELPIADQVMNFKKVNERIRCSTFVQWMEVIIKNKVKRKK